MKNILFILTSLILFSGNTSDSIVASGQINVTYMNYSASGDYESTDCFSNKKCAYSFHNQKNRLVTIVDFKNGQIEFISKEPIGNTTIHFEEVETPEDEFIIANPIEIPVFEIGHTDKTKKICGIDCKKTYCDA